jgi:hypothetical protein
MRGPAWLALCVLAWACSDGLPPASSVTDLRAVAALVDLPSGPGRANPSPGDDTEVSVLVIDRGAPPSDNPVIPALTPPLLQWEFVPCIPAPTRIGVPVCQTPIQPCEGCSGTPPIDPLAFPVLGFQVPSVDALQAADASSVLVQGAICADGAPAPFDAVLRFVLGETDVLNPCEDPKDEGRFITVQIPIEDDPDDPNLNPEIQTVTLNGSTWPPPYGDGVPRSAPRTGCRADLEGLTAQEQMAHPTAGSPSSTINLFVTPESLQPYVQNDEQLTEEIQVSWLADGGSFGSSFSFITDPARSALLSWEPPGDAPEEGLLVRFTFVIRDGRGGTDFLQRGLCILPP